MEPINDKTGYAEKVSTCRALCTDDLDVAVAALEGEGTTLIACGQQQQFFETLSADLGAPGQLLSVDIRDRAGWSVDADALSDAQSSAQAKQAALLAEAVLTPPDTPVRDIVSEGTILVLGQNDAALAAATRLADRLAVTCILENPPEDITPNPALDIARGTLQTASGALGNFKVVFDRYAPLDPAGRGPAAFKPAVDGARSTCDTILDLRGGQPLFTAHEKRDGYLRADPANPIAVEKAIFDASGYQGVFEKPLYIRYDAQICAHSRASQSGCERCLTVCPTGAITPAGDHVEIAADICAGCGACAAVCPSGAASYDDPPVAFLFTRLRTLTDAYRKAGGTRPRALFHDTEHGGEMIRLLARFGDGLPANVIPVDIANVEGVGHAEILAAFGVGFCEVFVLAGPKTGMDVPTREIELANALLTGTGTGDDRAKLIAPAEPDGLSEVLRASDPEPLATNPILPLGGRREVTRLAATALAGEAVEETVIALPEGAPYGAVAIDREACTLCLACVSLCPVGALGDNPDMPQVRFQETACLQCGICRSTCPENAITLVPQLDLRKDALSHQVLHEEEPFACTECGKLFGVKSTIETIVAKLEGKHWMYTNSDNTRLIQMCDDCRVNAQFHQENSPFHGGDRP
ncbi:MAG: 4Fe-4S binding protein, partial [Alphaproteobacteria bacterium]